MCTIIVCMKQEKKIQLPEYLRSYFWDVAFEDLEIKAYTEWGLN